MHKKHKICSKNFNSNSTIGVKNPIAEHSETNRRPNKGEDTQTITDLVDDSEPPSEHNKSFANQKLSEQIRHYKAKNRDKQTKIDYNATGGWYSKLGNYRIIGLAENILDSRISSSAEPKYIIDPDFDIGDEIHNPYAPENIKIPLCTIYYSKETNDFREMVQNSKFLSINLGNPSA